MHCHLATMKSCCHILLYTHLHSYSEVALTFYCNDDDKKSKRDEHNLEEEKEQ